MIETFCKCTTLMMVFHYFVLSCPYLSWVLLHFFVSYSWTIAYGYRNYLNLFKFFLLYLTKLCDHWQTLMKWNILLYIVFPKSTPLWTCYCMLMLQQFRTYLNSEQAKTSRIHLKRAKTSQNNLKKNCETTWNNPMLQKWGNLEFSTSFHFSNFESKCPNLGIFGEVIFQQNFTCTLFWIWVFCVKKY